MATTQFNAKNGLSVGTTPVSILDASGNASFTSASVAANGGITIASGAPGVTTNALYQVGSTLYFNGSEVGGGGGTTTNALTIGNGLSGGSFNGSSAVTIAVSAAANTDSSAYYPVFATSQGTAVALGTSAGLNYTPATGLLSVTALSSGNIAVSASNGITIASGAPSTTANTLYNVAGVLYFNGSAVGGTVSSIDCGGAS
jgi:hypothetical protein